MDSVDLFDRVYYNTKSVMLFRKLREKRFQFGHLGRDLPESDFWNIPVKLFHLYWFSRDNTAHSIREGNV